MSRRCRRNVAASVRDRLLSLARERGEDFQLLLSRYALERLLYRLGRSRHRDEFILKGAMLFFLWGDHMYRPTRDVDLLGFGDNSAARLQGIFRELCELSVEDDGLMLNADSVQVEEIRAEMEYGGMRVNLLGELADAHLSVQADIGFGDVVTPDARETTYPTLLDSPAPVVRVYPRETVVAEKYEALVKLGMANSRMKDFYDLWAIASGFDFAGVVLADAIRNTFQRRRTPLPEHTPTGLGPGFRADPQKNAQWNAFLRKTGIGTNSLPLAEVCGVVEIFLDSPTRALTEGKTFRAKWKAGGPWSKV